MYLLPITKDQKNAHAQKNCQLRKCFFYAIAKDPDPNNEVKMQQKLLFYFSYHLSYARVYLIR